MQWRNRRERASAEGGRVCRDAGDARARQPPAAAGAPRFGSSQSARAVLSVQNPLLLHQSAGDGFPRCRWCASRISGGRSSSSPESSSPSSAWNYSKDAPIPGWHHHVVLTAVAYNFLQGEHRKAGPDV